MSSLVPLLYTQKSSVSQTGFQTFGFGFNALLGRQTINYMLPSAMEGAWLQVSGQSSASGAVIGLKTDGSLWVWGQTAVNLGLLGDASNTILYSPVQIMAGSSFVFCGAGHFALSAIDTLGRLWTWGINSSGECGLGVVGLVSSPTQVGSLTNWTKCFGGSVFNNTMFYINSASEMYGAGGNGNGELGVGDTISRSSPVQVSGSWTMVSGRIGGTIGLQTNGDIFTWGNGDSGALGNGTIGPSLSVPVKIGSNYSYVTGGRGTACCFAIDTSGALFSWGNNIFGQLGLGDTTNRSSPVQVGALTSWSRVSSSAATIGIQTDGTVWGWGLNDNWQIGDGTVERKSSPVLIGNYSTATIFETSSGKTTSHWHLVDNTVYYTGAGVSIALNQGGYGGIGWNQLTPFFVDQTETYQSVSIGGNVAAAVTGDGRLFTWGLNGLGQCGQNSTQLVYSSPVQVGALSNWSIVACGSEFVIALKTDGTLWAWGSNSNGCLGIGTSTGFVSSPVQIGSGTDWGSISANEFNWLAIKTNGTLWANGLNTSGKLGLGDTTNRSSPVQVGALTDWSQVDAGHSHTLAIKTNGTLWAWGNNTLGELGLSTTVSQSSPVQVGAKTDWTKISAGRNVSAAIDASNRVYTWGQGVSGALGNGTTTNISSPVQVGSDQVWIDVMTASAAESNQTTYFLKNDGALWSSGNNIHGQLGIGSQSLPFSSPVFVTSNISVLGKCLSSTMIVF